MLTSTAFSVFMFYIAALQEQINASLAGMDSTVGESSPPDQVLKVQIEENNHEPIGLNIMKVPIDSRPHNGLTPPFIHDEFRIEGGTDAVPNVEHQFIPCFIGRSPVDEKKQGSTELKNLAVLRNGSDEEEISMSLQLGEPEPKRRKQSDFLLRTENSK